jgi:hypothetical protein
VTPQFPVARDEADLRVAHAAAAVRAGHRDVARRALLDALLLDPSHAGARRALIDLQSARPGRRPVRSRGPGGNAVACLLLGLLCLVGGRALGQPALDVAALLLALCAGLMAYEAVKRGRNADSA